MSCATHTLSRPHAPAVNCHEQTIRTSQDMLHTCANMSQNSQKVKRWCVLCGCAVTSTHAHKPPPPAAGLCRRSCGHLTRWFIRRATNAHAYNLMLCPVLQGTYTHSLMSAELLTWLSPAHSHPSAPVQQQGSTRVDRHKQQQSGSNSSTVT